MTLPQMLADQIGRMVNQKFSELMLTKQQHARRKVLAGVVITKGQDAELICVTTGKTQIYLLSTIFEQKSWIIC